MAPAFCSRGRCLSQAASGREVADHLADTASLCVSGAAMIGYGRRRGSLEARMGNGLVSVVKKTYTASLGEGTVPRPLVMPLVRGEMVGLPWVRPFRVGQDAVAGIAELANIAAAAGADEVVLAWETHDVATACELPVAGPAPCLNMVLATPAGHVLHQFPYTEHLVSRSPEGRASVAPGWRPASAPQPGDELVPAVRTAVDYAFTPIELDHPDPFGVTVVLMEEDGYRVRLTEAFTR